MMSHLNCLRLEQSKAPETRVTFAAYHQVVVDGDAQRLGRGFHFACHLDVVARGLGIAARMVVDLAFLDANELKLL